MKNYWLQRMSWLLIGAAVIIESGIVLAAVLLAALAAMLFGR